MKEDSQVEAIWQISAGSWIPQGQVMGFLEGGEEMGNTKQHSRAHGDWGSR